MTFNIILKKSKNNFFLENGESPNHPSISFDCVIVKKYYINYNLINRKLLIS